MAKKQKKRKSKPNKQQRKQQIAQRAKKRKAERLQQTKAYVKKYAVRPDGSVPRIVSEGSKSLRTAHRNTELGWYDLYVRTKAFNGKYGDACRQREDDWITLSDGKRVFVFSADTIEWSNEFFGDFSEDDMISVSDPNAESETTEELETPHETVIEAIV